jgi:hypothetical protein
LSAEAGAAAATAEAGDVSSPAGNTSATPRLTNNARSRHPLVIRRFYTYRYDVGVRPVNNEEVREIRQIGPESLGSAAGSRFAAASSYPDARSPPPCCTIVQC